MKYLFIFALHAFKTQQQFLFNQSAMKNNLDWYRHQVVAHRNWKFKHLRIVQGWEGEGKFWALNNMIAESEYAKLDLRNPIRFNSVAADLDFTPDQFTKFLLELTGVTLIENDNGIYTTKDTQEDFLNLDETRAYHRERKRIQRKNVQLDNTAKNELSNDTSELSNRTNGKSSGKKGMSQTLHNTTVNHTTLHLSNKLEREKQVGNGNSENSGNPDPQENLSLSPHPFEKKYKSFTEWCRQNTPSLFKLPEFITIDEYAELIKQFKGADGTAYLQKKLKEMHNTKSLAQKYNNVYSTLTKWIEMDQDLIKNKFIPRRQQP